VLIVKEKPLVEVNEFHLNVVERVLQLECLPIAEVIIPLYKPQHLSLSHADIVRLPWNVHQILKFLPSIR
jgi:hypothetical protein